ncbi:MAG TPA: hypothetical protein VJS65_06495 [Verrucomicrobiae bacterium]|nr:hypothetical protein [Verrucomicrobiae bacterium]
MIQGNFFQDRFSIAVRVSTTNRVTIIGNQLSGNQIVLPAGTNTLSP